MESHNSRSSEPNNGKPTAAATATATTTNAWAKPLPKTGPPPGMGAQADNNHKANSTSTSTSTTNGAGATDNNTLQHIAMIHRERMLHLILTLLGQKVVVHQTNGAVLEGVLHTFTPFSSLGPSQKNKYVLKSAKTVTKPSASTSTGTSTTDNNNNNNNNNDDSPKDGDTVLLDTSKVRYVLAKSINLDRVVTNGGTGGSNDFSTDTQISGGSAKKHDLVAAGTAWTRTNTNNHQTTTGGLEENAKGGAAVTRNRFGQAIATTTTTNAKLQGNIGEWDQFKANQELFNVNATFDENLYTTELDKSQMDSKKIAEAERIAREIENTASTNIHIAEERGHKVETDFDEEDRYSGVLTKDGKQRHDGKQQRNTNAAITTTQKDKKNSNTEPAAAVPATTTAPKPKGAVMNYAAAAAKADTSKKVGPPGFSGAKGAAAAATESKEAEKPKSAEESSKPEEKKDEASKEESTKEKKEEGAKKDDKKTGADESKDKDKKEETKDASTKSKLNANAKSFSFNPSAKSFTPSFGAAPTTTQPQHVVDPNAAMHMQQGSHPMQQHPHYLHGAPMGRPGTLLEIISQVVCSCSKSVLLTISFLLSVDFRYDAYDEPAISCRNAIPAAIWWRWWYGSTQHATAGANAATSACPGIQRPRTGSRQCPSTRRRSSIRRRRDYCSGSATRR